MPQIIYISVHKVFNSKVERCYRSGGEWCYDLSEKTQCEISISHPIRFCTPQHNTISYILKNYCSYEYMEDCVSTPNGNKEVFSPEWTKEICILFNAELSCNQYEFREFKPTSGVNCPYVLINSYDMTLAEYSYKITGRCVKTNTSSTEIAYSPFATLDELKDGIDALHSVDSEPPQQWIYYLIKHAENDLSEFLTKNKINIDYKRVPICNSIGELWPSIRYYNCQAVEYYNSLKPQISYLDALSSKKSSAVRFYENLGANYIQAMQYMSERYMAKFKSK